MNAQLVPREEDLPPQPAMLPAASTTPSQLLALAVQQGADLDRLERLMALQERWEANEARKAFTASMTAFKAEPLAIAKDKHVSFQKRDGSWTEYDHATLGNVVRSIIAGMARHGLSHSWVTEQRDGRIKVTCKVTHALGHSESVSLDAAPDDSGGKNAIQAVGSAVSYLQRYSLLAILGLATEDQDDDGRRSGEPAAETAPEPDSKDAAAKRKAVHDAALARHSESVQFIKDRIAADDLQAAADEWAAIPPDDQMALWLATSKGGTFSTEERKTIKEKLPKGVAK